ncbi:unnamed protein product [Caenorhabditis angaria]|uniref:Plus3 domain-containing protein n=1 Tax=Caenorhabditis angaria TaxID=860376 RepID=A0A9P1IXD7_9PELO|nr:unnamed protein product [Caenorhabditis angaria]
MSSSSSSDHSDSSDDERMPQQNTTIDSGSDSDAGDKRKRAGRSTKKTIESGGSSDSDSEVEKKRPTKKKAATKRKRKSSGTSDDDRIDDSLFQDAEDKARWKNLSELEKEREIFERMEARENQRARDEIAQQLKAKKERELKKAEKRKKKASSDEESAKSAADSSDEDPEFHRPSEVHRKHKEKNAMAELKQKRKEIEKKNAKAASLSIDAVFGAGDGSESSSSSSSSASSRSSSRSSSRDSSPTRFIEEEKIVRKELDTLDELIKARLSRFKLCKFVHAPFFKETVVGGYVKVGMGFMGGSDSKYKIWQVVDVEETGKIYDVDGKRTNKGLKCRFGRQERVFRIAFVSNSEFNRAEFDEWYRITKEQSNIPTMDIIEKKEKEIKRAMDHKFSDKEVDALIEEKRRFQKVPRNIAMTKADWNRKKELAQQAGDLREAEKYQAEIDKLEKHASEIDKKRSHDISGIAFINFRNRTQNKNEILSGSFKMQQESQDDPFTRKKGGMRVVSGSKGGIKLEIKTEGDISASSSSTNLSDLVKTEVKSEECSPEKKPRFASPIKEKRKSANMFDLHNSASTNLNFNINIEKLLNNSKGPRDDGHLDSAPPAPSFDAKPRGLSLADYRRRKAESASTTTA